MHWKVARDPFYRALDPALLEEAGFFEDTATTDAPLDDVRWLCTPMRKVRGRLGRGGDGPPIVLLSTGAFSPVHNGHLAMMAAARRAAEAAGWWVVGGYLSPGHDEYISMKLGAQATDAHTRVLWCAQATAGSDWLDVDPWEALHRAVAVNFTDVIVRLQAYLRHHLDPRVEVAFVFGTDNARFALTFLQQGRAIGVTRPGHDPAPYPARTACPRILWADGDHPGSSTRVRAGERHHLPETLRAPVRPTRLTLRAEGTAAVPLWPGLQPRLPAFFAGLEALLSAHFSLRRVPLPAQSLPDVGPIISLDPMLPAEHNLAISRAFALGGYGRWGHVARPGAPPLEAQAAAIPPGRYTLVDDDVVSGETIAAVRRLLPPSAAVDGVCAVLDGADGEIADSRDFLLGSAHGGAVVSLPSGGLGRAPYLLPYIDPFARASVPPSAVHAFSRAVWALNRDLFDGSGLRVGDLPPPSRQLICAAGFGGGERLAAVCAWHAAALQD